MRMRIARLFTIKTRTEVWLVIYALSLGAVERGIHYLETYPGWGGVLLALACTGVVFLAGAKLLDSVGRAPELAKARSYAPRQRSPISRSRPRLRPSRFGSESPLSLRRGSRRTIRP
jgi:hypothetical protein